MSNTSLSPNSPKTPLLSSQSHHHHHHSSQDTNTQVYNSIWNSKTSQYYQSDFFTAITTAPTTNDIDSIDMVTAHHDVDGGPAMILGWLSQRKQFGLITMDTNLSDAISLHCSFDSTVLDQNSSTHSSFSSSRSDSSSHSGSNQQSIQTGRKETDWAWCQILSPLCYHEEPLANYLDAVALHNYVSLPNQTISAQSLEASSTSAAARDITPTTPLSNPLPLPVGWCSWYHYYEHITTQNLLQNFHKLGGLKYEFDCNLAVVDDGYMTAWGDWDSLKPKSFPPIPVHNSTQTNTTNATTQIMRSISKAIKDNGMKPGVWLAPYACDKHSTIAKLHPDWIIKNEKGRYANSSNCGKFFYGLDATNPAVREHAFKAVRRAVEEW